MTRLGRIGLRSAAAVAVLYATACGVVGAAYRYVVFPAPSRAASPLPNDAQKIEARTPDGVMATAIRFGPAPKDAPLTIVLFHGNAELAEDNADLARSLASHEWAVVVAEYRGYGMSRGNGQPTERGLYDDAEGIIDSLDVPSERLALFGISLGTGVAVEMAARGHGRALVLLAPYTSIPAVAERSYPFLPMHFLIRDALDSESKAMRIGMPVFVAHGDRDEVIPFDMGETVAHTFPHGRFVAVPGAHHNDMFTTDDHLLQKLVDFIAQISP